MPPSVNIEVKNMAVAEMHPRIARRVNLNTIVFYGVQMAVAIFCIIIGALVPVDNTSNDSTNNSSSNNNTTNSSSSNDSGLLICSAVYLLIAGGQLAGTMAFIYKRLNSSALVTAWVALNILKNLFILGVGIAFIVISATPSNTTTTSTNTGEETPQVFGGGVLAGALLLYLSLGDMFHFPYLITPQGQIRYSWQWYLIPGMHYCRFVLIEPSFTIASAGSKLTVWGDPKERHVQGGCRFRSSPVE